MVFVIVFISINFLGLIDAITPGNIPGLRKIVNETSMDIMYYTSAYFRSEVSDVDLISKRGILLA